MLSSILCPVDFSDNSQNALQFALYLASRLSGHIVMLHAEPENNEEAYLQLKDLSEKSMSAHNNVICEPLLLDKGLVAAVQHAVETYHIDLIVMGTKGASGWKKTFIGSNTVNVFENVKCPVLAIPNEFSYDEFLDPVRNRVVLASDFEFLQNEDALDPFMELVEIIPGANVKILGVRPENTQLREDKRLERRRIGHFLGRIRHSRVTIFSDDVIRGINFYLAKKDDIAMVTMITKSNQRGLFDKQHTAEMASQVNFPLLVLHDEKD